MKKKRFVPVLITILAAVLWFTGTIPVQIAKIAGTRYVTRHFPEMELKFESIEYADVFGDYLIAFRDKNDKVYSCVIGPEWLPITLGQGLMAIQGEYEEHYLTIVQPHVSIPEFSYEEDSKLYREGMPGVKTSGFVNTTETEVDYGNVDAVAAKECTIEWDTSRAYQDTAAAMWKVVFYQEGTVGGDQTVYLDYDGKTVLIVYGE